MKRILVVFALAGALHAQDSLFSQIEGISRDLETITGLKFKRPVPSAVLDKDQLRKFLDQRIDKAMKPADLKAESLILRMLGLIPSDFDLRRQTVDLLTEQAAAFYDYQRKKLFLLKGDTGEAAVMALAHELGHALADQNFHLEKYIKQNNQSDDAASARMAVMEGQATWLMSAWLHQRAGLSPDVPAPILETMSNSLEPDAAQYPVYAQSPLYVRESLVFPYKEGMRFQDAIFRKLGKEAFGEVFRRAPVSTQQIMHPEDYLDRTAPKMPALPVVPDAKRFRKLAEGTLGEMDYRVLLTQYGDKDLAGSLAHSLIGSQFALLEHRREGFPVLVWASNWNSPQEARRFFDFYRNALKAKAQKPEPGRETGTTLEGRNEKGFYRVLLRDAAVESIEGMKTSVN